MAISSRELNNRSEHEAPGSSSCGASVRARPDDGPLDGSRSAGMAEPATSQFLKEFSLWNRSKKKHFSLQVRWMVQHRPQEARMRIRLFQGGKEVSLFIKCGDKVRSQKQITGLFGNFSQVADPPPPLLGTPYSKKKFIVYFAF